MTSPFVIPLSALGGVVLIVAIVQLARIREVETDIHRRLHEEEMEHQRRMRELDFELARVRQGGRTTTPAKS